MYKLLPPIFGQNVQRLSDGSYIPFAPDNTDYQAFKAALKAGTAQLEDANGTAMTAEQITTFVSTLP